MHTECKGQVELHNFIDEFDVVALPVIYGDHDVSWWRVSGLKVLNVLVHPISGFLDILEELRD